MKNTLMKTASRTACFVVVVLLISGVASAQVAKVDICHKKGKKGNYVLKSFTQNAISAHLKHGDGFPGDPYPGMEGSVFGADCSPEGASAMPLCGYEVVTSQPLNYPDGGWGWFADQGAKIVTGGGFELTGGPAAASAPVTPYSTWAGYTFRNYEYGWVVQDYLDGNTSFGSYVYSIFTERPSGYEIVTSPELAFSDGGFGGWSCPAGKVILGGGFVAEAPVAVSAPGTPDSVWPHYEYASDEYGWVIQDAADGASNTITIYAICADMPAGYEVLISDPQDLDDGGYGGWTCPVGKIVTGGGFDLGGGPTSASAPGTPESVWGDLTFLPGEYGWVVRDAVDGLASPDSTVYAICTDRCP